MRKARDHPNVLGFDIDHEPSVAETEAESLLRRDRFLVRRSEIRAIDPDRSVFTVDYPTVRPDRFDLWQLWKNTGDVASFWTYPVAGEDAVSVGGPVGVGETVRWATDATAAQKPLWFVGQAFESPLRDFDWRMPEPRQLRAMAYDALVHGATGLIWFSLDSFVTRAGRVIGIAPDAQEQYSLEHPHIRNGQNLMRASSSQIEGSRRLWQAVSRLNRELAAHREIWLSPTSRLDYDVEIRGAKTSTDPFRTHLKRTRDGLYLIGVNVDDSPVDVRIRPRFPLAALELRAGDAPLSLRDGRIVGTLQGFATFVLKFEQASS
ncbi:MAG: hypothetical protein JJ899_10640 [Alphaproteobacteria bacterium]|nr:hypothetical protein [Alphaproteobacteria bacterium]